MICIIHVSDIIWEDENPNKVFLPEVASIALPLEGIPLELKEFKTISNFYDSFLTKHIYETLTRIFKVTPVSFAKTSILTNDYLDYCLMGDNSKQYYCSGQQSFIDLMEADRKKREEHPHFKNDFWKTNVVDNFLAAFLYFRDHYWREGFNEIYELNEDEDSISSFVRYLIPSSAGFFTQTFNAIHVASEQIKENFIIPHKAIKDIYETKTYIQFHFVYTTQILLGLYVAHSENKPVFSQQNYKTVLMPTLGVSKNLIDVITHCKVNLACDFKLSSYNYLIEQGNFTITFGLHSFLGSEEDYAGIEKLFSETVDTLFNDIDEIENHLVLEEVRSLIAIIRNVTEDEHLELTLKTALYTK